MHFPLNLYFQSIPCLTSFDFRSNFELKVLLLAVQNMSAGCGYVWCWKLGSRAFAQIKKPYSQMGKWAPCSNGKRWKSARKELKFSLVCTADGACGSAVHIRQNKSAVREFLMTVTHNFIKMLWSIRANPPFRIWAMQVPIFDPYLTVLKPKI